MSNENLEIKLMERPNASRFLKVRLRSIIKPQIIAEIEVEDQGSESRTEQRVLASAGALTEHLEREYGDNYNADDIALEARELYREMMSEFNQNLN